MDINELGKSNIQNPGRWAPDICPELPDCLANNPLQIVRLARNNSDTPSLTYFQGKKLPG